MRAYLTHHLDCILLISHDRASKQANEALHKCKDIGLQSDLVAEQTTALHGSSMAADAILQAEC